MHWPLRQLLAFMAPFVIGTAASGEELLSHLEAWKPDAITLDLSMPGIGGLRTLDRIMAKLAHTSESVIHVAIVALNLDTWLRTILFWLSRAALGIAESFRN